MKFRIQLKDNGKWVVQRKFLGIFWLTVPRLIKDSIGTYKKYEQGSKYTAEVTIREYCKRKSRAKQLLDEAKHEHIAYYTLVE